MVRFPLLLSAVLAAVAVGAACAGGGGGDAGGGQRITDPAKVATATPIQGAPVFKISGDTVSAPGGTTTVQAGQSPTTGGAGTYTVKSGDICESIARQFGITTAALLAANRTINENCSNLQTGQQLRIPGASGTTATATSKPGTTTGRTYTVKSGDNCFDIAASFGVTSQAIIDLNGLDAGCTGLHAGQVLKIP